jgi:transcriptional regulator with XRE-family HTH domain
MEFESIIMAGCPMNEVGINRQIAERVHKLRVQRGLSLDGLAERSGVSRSMISLVERGEANPTAVFLEKLAGGLNTSLAALFEPLAAVAEPVARRVDQPVWRDPGSGYVRRNVSPSGHPTPIQLVEVVFPPGAHVAYETGGRQPAIHQQVWVLEGMIEVTVGDQRYDLDAGDCLAFVLDRPTAFSNHSSSPARYMVAIVAGSGLTR